MSSYVTSVASSAFWNLRLLKDGLVRSICPPISVRGLVGIPGGLFLLSVATALWILAFFLLPVLLISVWTALQPYRLWLFLRNRMIGRNFLS